MVIAKQTEDWNWTLAVVAPALHLSDPALLDDVRLTLEEQGVMRAVAARDSAAIYDWLVEIIQYQGISDANAAAFTVRHGRLGWGDVASGMTAAPVCPRLRSYWHFDRCGYRKSAAWCSEPHLLSGCPLPTHPIRNGRLSQAAYSLFLFIRDICDGDLVGWLDERLDLADDAGAPDRAKRLRRALLEPMRNIHGVSDKVLSMALSSLLLVGDPDRGRWVTAGASMIVVDTLVHNFLHRTGILRRYDADHAYGAGCYSSGGCADILEELARRVDARIFNPTFPAFFPRFIQHAIWRFCAASWWNICNGNQIDDRDRCDNRCCPSFEDCGRMPLRAEGGSS